MTPWEVEVQSEDWSDADIWRFTDYPTLEVLTALMRYYEADRIETGVNAVDWALKLEEKKKILVVFNDSREYNFILSKIIMIQHDDVNLGTKPYNPSKVDAENVEEALEQIETLMTLDERFTDVPFEESR